MSITREAPMPTTGPWAVVAGPHSRLAVIGTTPLLERLTPHLPVVALGHRDPHELDRVSGLVVQASAFEPGTGPWSYGLAPTGFDRTAGLVRVLDEARERGLPVGLLDDSRGPTPSPWLAELAALVDRTARVLPAAGIESALEGVPVARWQPPLRIDADLVRLGGAVGAGVAPVELSLLTSLPLRTAQHRAALAATVRLDAPHDPWSCLLATELGLAGVAVEGAPPVADWTDSVRAPAAATLCAWLGVDEPITPTTIVLLPPGAGRTEGDEVGLLLGDRGAVRPATDVGPVFRDVGSDDQVVLPPVDHRPLEPSSVRALVDLARWVPDAPAVGLADVHGAVLVRGPLAALLPDDLDRARDVAARVAIRRSAP